MKHYLLLIIFSCISTLALAQTATLSGRVTDHNNKPVDGATVVIKELNKMAVTDEDGKYQFNQVKHGEYTISITSITILPEVIKVKVTGDKTVANAHVKAPKDKELTQVVVQAKTEKRKIETSGFAVNVVDTKEASLRNLQVNELLNRTVGVRVRQSGGLGSDANYNLNGMSGRAIGIFIDGIEISTYGSSFNLNNIPPALIERIEIYKGVLPAHLSGDFLGGGINVILKKGGMRSNLIASASYGSFNTQQADLTGMYRDPATGFTVRGSGFYSYTDNDYEVWGQFVRNEQPNGTMVETRGKRFNDAYRSYGGRLEAGFTDVKWADNFIINYNYSHTYDEVQHGQYMSRPYMGRFSRSNANVIGLDYKKNDLFLPGLNFTFNGVYSDRKQYIEDTVSYRYNWDGKPVIGIRGEPLRTLGGAQQGAPTMNTIDRQIATLRSSLSYNVAENHKVVFNHMFYVVDRQDFDALRTVLERNYFSTSDLTKNVSALSYEAQLFDGRLITNLFGKLYQQKIDRMDPIQQTVNGQPTRVERVTTDNRNTTGYGFAASYALKPNFVVIASAEKAVRMPGESEIFGNQADNLLPNPSIRPEISNNFNLGVRAGSYNLNGHKVSVSAGGFLRDTKDKIVMLSSDRAITNMETSNNVNLSGVRSIGFEAEVNYVFQKLNVVLNVSKFNALLQDPASNYDGRQIPNEPFFTGNGNVQYRFDDVISKKSIMNVYYNFGYVHPFETIWQLRRDEFNVTPRQFIQDVGMSYRFPSQRIVVSFDAKNIFNKEAYDNFAAQKPGRAFYLKLNYSINNL
ncbi:TonB-dependent receptor [Mucilaginibacter sp. JRF]|uniref:TonB-dependent receptor n=1 Tax=Mucilaginibacter sp. JRF TaxID=2780088 RepID=UPI00188048C4|nr:TonB-dependent receptor [Mucilaginibacter sp. JRF]MBE9586401.1 TonB-dependent receptor [Mucilaginibacter sp. JRF]